MNDTTPAGRTKYYIGVYDSASHVRVELHEQDIRRAGLWKNWPDTYRHRIESLTVYTGWNEPPPVLPPSTPAEGPVENGGMVVPMRKFLEGNGLLVARPFTIYYKDRREIDKPPGMLLNGLRDDAAAIRGKLGDIITAYPLWRDRLTYLQGTLTAFIVAGHSEQEEIERHREKHGHNPQWILKDAHGT